MAYAATWMDPEILILSEVSQTVTVQCDVAYVWNLKKKKKKTTTTETDSDA